MSGARRTTSPFGEARRTVEEPRRKEMNEARGDEIDSELLERARGDFEGAFGDLYDRHKDEVHGWLVRFLGEPELAEEALQESFFRAYRGLETFDPSRPFRPWLHQVVRNTALDLLRARTKAHRNAATQWERTKRPTPSEPLAALAQSEQVKEVGRALAALPNETRALLLQRHGLGLKLEELAQSWSLNERTLRTRLQKAASELAALVLAARGSKVRGSSVRDSSTQNSAEEDGSRS